MSRKRYTEEEIKRHVEINSNCKFIGTYIRRTPSNRRRILQLICGCGKEFEVEWVKFNRTDSKFQRQCRSCGIKMRAKEQRMTDEEYIQEKIKRGITIEHLEPADGKSRKTRHRCPICKTTDWYPMPKDILNGYSTKCAKCQTAEIAGHNKSDDVTYQWQKLQKGINIINIEPYIDSRTNITHICPDCEKEWKVSPSRILSKNSQRCESCSYIKRGTDKLHAVEEVNRIVEERGVIWVSGEYNGQDSMLTFECECGNLFEKRFSDLRFGWTRCKECTVSISYGEYHIDKWLKKNEARYTFQRKFDDLRGKRNMPLSYDFSIDDPDDQPIALIEYDGEHHFKPMYHRYKTKKEAEEQFEKVRYYDKKKDEYAKKKGIPLIRLSSNKYKKLDDYLKHLL